MSNNKQTAVEWLLNQMDLETISKYDKQLLQAKAMEKEQIIEFANDFWTETDSTVEHTNAEIFYNKIFKSE